MQINLNKFAAIALAMLMVTSGVAAGAATFDTETTSTATTSDVSGSTNTVVLDPGNASESVYVETDGATTSNLTLELTPAEPGVDHLVYSNASPATENSSAGHYSWNVTHDELEDIPRDANGGTYNATVINNSDGSEVLNTEVTFDTKNNDNTAVLAVTDDAGTDAAAMTNLVADQLEIESKSGGWLSKAAFWSSSNGTDVTTFSGYTTVNGTNSEFVVDLANSTTASAYADSAEGVDDGDWMKSSTIFINGVPQKVYKNEAPEDVNGTVVVYNENTDQLEGTLGEEYSGVRNVNIRSTANDGYDFTQIWDNFGAMDALGSLTDGIPLL